ncbi:MAG: plasmid mobilization relaxosome protein MobC [Cyanobacteria bacterium P01_G01_bin.19]
MSASERTELEAKASAAGLKLSPYLRQAGLNKTIRPSTKIPEINLATYVELGRIGNNINQMTKAAHKSLQRGMGCNVNPTELSALLRLLKQVRLEILAIDQQEDDDS